MRYIDDFNTIDEATEEPLVIHRHGSSSGRALIVLMHGLGGERYGTWTPKGEDPLKVGLAKFLYEDVEGMDIGLYAYRTLLGRLKFWKSIPLKREAEVLADRIRDQARVYKTVILAGHSMGGILAKAAIANLIASGDVGTLSAIRALMLLATPQAGSLRVPKLVWNLTEDGRVLRAHSGIVTETETLFTDRVAGDPIPARPDLFVIPAYVVAAAEDNWVDEFSAGLNVPRPRRNTIRGSHKSAVKPATKDDDSYEWLRDRIREVVHAFAPATASGAQDKQAGFDSLTKVLLQNGEVFLNRRILRCFLSDLISRDARSRVLVVNGPAGSGKSYTGVLANSVARATGSMAYRRFEPSAMEFVPAFVRSVFDGFRWRSDTASLTMEPIPGQIRFLAEVIRRKAQESEAITLLHVDVREQPPYDTLEFLQTLIMEPGQLALILTGFSKDWVPPEGRPRVVFENLADLLFEDVRDGVERAFRESNRSIPDQQIDILTQVVLENASKAPSFNSGVNSSVKELVAKLIG